MIKNANAKIFDADTENLIAEIGLKIELVIPSNNEGKPHFVVTGTINKFHPELSNNIALLEINPNLRGYAHFSIKRIAGWFTEYRINLQDSIWRNLDWFENLEN